MTNGAPVFPEIFSEPIGEPVRSSGPVVPPEDFFLLRENGFRFAREDSGFILREH